MSIENLKAYLPDFAREVKLNLTLIQHDELLSAPQRAGLLLAAALTTRNRNIIATMTTEAGANLSAQAFDAVRAIVATQAMTNTYHRFVAAFPADYANLPAKLHVPVMGYAGVPKRDSELWALAVSALNGCAACMVSHEKAAREAGATRLVIQAAVRFAAIIQSAALALESAELSPPRS